MSLLETELHSCHELDERPTTELCPSRRAPERNRDRGRAKAHRYAYQRARTARLGKPFTFDEAS
jgi:hypothetical protein